MTASGDTGGSAKIAKIGVIAPLSGDLSALGLGIQHSVELAVKQANDNKTIPGWTLEVDAEDDQAKADAARTPPPSSRRDDERRRCRRHAELQRRRRPSAGLRCRQHRPGLAGQHRTRR